MKDFRLKSKGRNGEEDHCYNFQYNDIVAVPFFNMLMDDSLRPGKPSCCFKCGILAKNTAVSKLKKCSQCKFAEYGGVECQRADWANHKRACSEDLKKKSRNSGMSAMDVHYVRVVVPPQKNNPVFYSFYVRSGETF